MIALVLGFLIYATPVFAAQGFYPLHQLPIGHRLALSRAQRESVADAVVRIQIQLDATHTGSCTGIMISSQGHLLTPLHCVGPGLIRRRMAHEEQVGGLTVVRTQGVTAMALPELIVNNRQGSILGRPYLLGVGRGYARGYSLSNNPSQTPDRDVALLNAYLDQDFALLQVVPQNATLSCLHLSSQNSMQHQQLWSFGYPGATQRIASANSDGRSLFTSWGHFVRELTPGLRLGDLDGVRGSSGSAVINNRGQLVGMVTNSGSDIQRYESQSLNYINIAIIQQSLDQNPLPGVARFNYFSCP